MSFSNESSEHDAEESVKVFEQPQQIKKPRKQSYPTNEFHEITIDASSHVRIQSVIDKAQSYTRIKLDSGVYRESLNITY